MAPSVTWVVLRPIVVVMCVCECRDSLRRGLGLVRLCVCVKVWIEHLFSHFYDHVHVLIPRLLSSRSLDGAPVQHTSYGHIVNFVYLCVIDLNFLERIVLLVGNVGKVSMCVCKRSAAARCD